jgi:hypothetical protein
MKPGMNLERIQQLETSMIHYADLVAEPGAEVHFHAGEPLFEELAHALRWLIALLEIDESRRIR